MASRQPRDRKMPLTNGNCPAAQNHSIGQSEPVQRRNCLLNASQGFSLVELLVVMTVVAILVAVSGGVCGKIVGKRKSLKEVAAAKTLIQAYALHAAENSGRYLPGMDYTVNQVWFEPYGKNITSTHAANRYPFRLAPYFGYRLDGTILVNDNGKQIEEQNRKGTSMYDYSVSAFPALGINYWYVGGCVSGAGDVTFPDECVTHQTGASILVFASAASRGDSGNGYDGFNILTPPRMHGPSWSGEPWKKNSNPSNYGNVDARHDGKAVCAFLDGSVRLHTIEELRDMRKWNKNASERNDPDYTIKF
jgi:prepilin-type N-terminal cleavage/methylation domain-containing protein/prepilin-type processing-associated H-X9-DG protein